MVEPARAHSTGFASRGVPTATLVEAAKAGQASVLRTESPSRGRAGQSLLKNRSRLGPKDPPALPQFPFPAPAGRPSRLASEALRPPSRLRRFAPNRQFRPTAPRPPVPQAGPLLIHQRTSAHRLPPRHRLAHPLPRSLPAPQTPPQAGPVPRQPSGLAILQSHALAPRPLPLRARLSPSPLCPFLPASHLALLPAPHAPLRPRARAPGRSPPHALQRRRRPRSFAVAERVQGKAARPWARPAAKSPPPARLALRKVDSPFRRTQPGRTSLPTAAESSQRAERPAPGRVP
jgi:hypothetical protein